jgi:legumain
VIDYRGKDVNLKNFKSIMEGNAKEVTGGNGRVLKSTANDEVFLFYADHGSMGLVSFPAGILPYMFYFDL